MGRKKFWPHSLIQGFFRADDRSTAGQAGRGTRHFEIFVSAILILVRFFRLSFDAGERAFDHLPHEPLIGFLFQLGNRIG
ncbi:hypothetical protein Enr17x_43680 [Gimesia fumaroli]|uniref:Uncharacterized protein n=1 Tax=Gimesia fumaroli TaxID=2527976 RepID=A0A518IGU9_9PLAN|nr:hypothetical protein Enr17x_43680 [Gimesia fumaroli]